MLHKSYFRFRVEGVPVINAFFLSYFWEYQLKSYITKKWILFGDYIFVDTESNFNYFGIIGPKAAKFDENA